MPVEDDRILVVARRVVAAARRPSSRGDGTRIIREIVEEFDADPCRGEGLGSAFAPIDTGDGLTHVLSASGLSPESVPRAGQAVRLRPNASL